MPKICGIRLVTVISKKVGEFFLLLSLLLVAYQAWMYYTHIQIIYAQKTIYARKMYTVKVWENQDPILLCPFSA